MFSSTTQLSFFFLCHVEGFVVCVLLLLAIYDQLWTLVIGKHARFFAFQKPAFKKSALFMARDVGARRYQPPDRQGLFFLVVVSLDHRSTLTKENDQICASLFKIFGKIMDIDVAFFCFGLFHAAALVALCRSGSSFQDGSFVKLACYSSSYLTILARWLLKSCGYTMGIAFILFIFHRSVWKTPDNTVTPPQMDTAIWKGQSGSYIESMLQKTIPSPISCLFGF